MPAAAPPVVAERIADFRELPRLARQAVAGLTPAQLDTPYREGGWTVRQVIHHVADAHVNAFIRMKLVLAEDHPTIKPWDQDVWAAMPDGRSAPVEDSLTVLDGVHARIARLLESVPADGWQRGAFHPERGEITLADLREIYANHGRHHIEQIVRLRGARGW